MFEEHQGHAEFGPLLERMKVVDKDGESQMDEDQWEAASASSRSLSSLVRCTCCLHPSNHLHPFFVLMLLFPFLLVPFLLSSTLKKPVPYFLSSLLSSNPISSICSSCSHSFLPPFPPRAPTSRISIVEPGTFSTDIYIAFALEKR